MEKRSKKKGNHKNRNDSKWIIPRREMKVRNERGENKERKKEECMEIRIRSKVMDRRKTITSEQGQEQKGRQKAKEKEKRRGGGKREKRLMHRNEEQNKSNGKKKGDNEWRNATRKK